MAAIIKDYTYRPPWSGPSDKKEVLTKVVSTKDAVPEQYPIKSADNPNLFPPVCLRSHWDPTQIIQRTLPNAHVDAPLEPRPWTRVCMNYVTSQPFEQAPRPADGVVFPMGGTVYPFSRYRENVQHESELKGLDRPLGTCERDQYIPPQTGNLFRANSTVPDRPEPNIRFIQELAFPQACMRTGVYDCVAQAQKINWENAPMPFNNATKQSRYNATRPDLVRQPPNRIPRHTPQPMPTELSRLS
jgi:hypothetical protein